MKLPDDRNDNPLGRTLIGLLMLWTIVFCIFLTPWFRRVYQECNRPATLRIQIHKPSRVRVSTMSDIERTCDVTREMLDRVVDALRTVESQGRNVTGDGGRAVGEWQMWPIAVAEFNRITGKHYTNADRLDPAKSREMCSAILDHWQRTREIEDPVQLAGLWRNPKGNVPEWYENRVKEAMGL